jgi:RNA polymerase sigma factor (sigma-70 family)
VSKPNADEPKLVRAAQRGDQRARDALVRKYLPLVYNIVGRSLHGYPDIDDVVQETMLRIVRDLSAARNPEGFRSWVGAVAARQVGTYLRQAAEAAQLTAALSGLPVLTVEFEEAAVLRLRLSGQRREVAEAGGWLDQEDRVALALWWLEAAGEMTRDEVAGALETTTAYAAVRIQRMRTQLDLSRSVVTALAASPCGQLGLTTADWDGKPSALWRKRIFRHVRGCAVCLTTSQGRIAAERLFVGYGLAPVPALLTAKVIGMTAAQGAQAAKGAQAARGSWVSRAVLGNPVMAATAGAVVVALATACAATLPGGPGQPPKPTTAARGMQSGAVMLAGPVTATMSHSPQARRPPHPHAHTSTTAHSSTPVTAPVAASPLSPHAGCGSHSADIWANWPMPNSPGTGLPNPESYTNLGNGTVRDNVTCLIWQRSPAPGTYTFTQAKAYCASLTLARGSWQLPTRIQLMSIVDPAHSGPAIDTTAFPDTPAQYFWTSSPWFVTSAPLHAWLFNFYEGMESNAGLETGTYQVRCVQSAAGTGEPGYQIADGQVTDPATGLTWQQAPSATTMPASAAPSYCAGLDLGARSWRLPSIKELATLVDEDRVSPAIDVSAFPGVAPDVWFWSSTVSAPAPPEQWALNFNDGFSYFRSTSDTSYVRCVR